MISLKDYAADSGVSYEAVRRQIKRYEKELEGHIHKEGRTQFLDDEAVAFLEAHRAKTPIAVYDKSRDEELERLREENQLLYNKVVQLQEDLLKSYGKIEALHEEKLALQGEKIALMEAASKPRRKWRLFGNKED